MEAALRELGEECLLLSEGERPEKPLPAGERRAGKGGVG